MTEKKYTEEEYQQLLKQIKFLKGENKYLKKLTSSKRFRFAEKMANGYNGVFPKDTKRRKVAEKVGVVGRYILSTKDRLETTQISNEIIALAEKYEKIIVLNSIPWDIKLKQRPHHLANEFNKLGLFVIYLEYENPLKKFRVIRDGLIVINSDSFIRKLPLKHSEKCYFLTPNNMPTPFDAILEIKNNGYKVIYDYLDEFHEDISGDLSIQKETWDKLSKLSPVLCTATAKRLQNDLVEHLGKKQKIISASNAVNVEHFDYTKNTTKSCPADLKPATKDKKPVIGFYGALAPWIDFSMLNDIAIKHQEWNFVYLGVDYNGAAASLRKGDNVFNLGAKNYSDLPKYAKYFDCAIIPFKKGEIAKATSPVKLFEYMAAGLPTVCTRDLQECNGYEYVYMSKNDEDFATNLAKAISDHKKESVRKKLLEQANKNTWAQRAKTIVNALGEVK